MQKCARVVRDCNGLQRIAAGKDVPGVALRADRARRLVDDLVLELDRRPFDLGETDLDHRDVVVLELAFVSGPDFNDRELVSHLLELLVSEASIAAPGAARLFVPKEVVGVIGVAHLVGLAVADADSFVGGRKRSFRLEAVRHGREVTEDAVLEGRGVQGRVP